MPCSFVMKSVLLSLCSTHFARNVTIKLSAAYGGSHFQYRLHDSYLMLCKTLLHIAFNMLICIVTNAFPKKKLDSRDVSLSLHCSFHILKLYINNWTVMFFVKSAFVVLINALKSVSFRVLFMPMCSMLTTCEHDWI